MSLAEPATIRSMTLRGDGADDFASGGEAIVVLNAAKHGQGDQLATGYRLLDQLGIGIGYGMCRLRRARAVVVFDEFSDGSPNVGGIEKDEVIERIFAQRAMESLDVGVRIRGVIRRRKPVVCRNSAELKRKRFRGLDRPRRKASQPGSGPAIHIGSAQ